MFPALGEREKLGEGVVIAKRCWVSFQSNENWLKLF